MTAPAPAGALPLYFISGVFVPEDQIPSLLRAIADVFPIRHLAVAMLTPCTHSQGTGIAARDLLIVAAWGVAGLAFAARAFQWSPRTT